MGTQQEGSVSYAGCLRTGSYIFYSVFFALIVFIFSLTCAHCRRPGWLSPRDVDMRRDSKICNICLARCVNPLSRFGSTSGCRVFDMLFLFVYFTSVFCETRIHSFPLVYSLVSCLYLGFMGQEYSPVCVNHLTGISGNVLSRDAWVPGPVLSGEEDNIRFRTRSSRSKVPLSDISRLHVPPARRSKVRRKVR